MIQGIAIVGGNGSGKTTLGKALAARLGWKAMDVEDYYFNPSSVPYAEPRTKGEVTQLLLADMKAHKRFVFSSVNCDYGPEINRLYSCVIYLQVPGDIRLARVKQRAVDKFGNRVLEGGDMYEQEQQFFKFVASRSMEKTDTWVQSLTCPVIHLDGTQPISTNTEAAVHFLRNHLSEKY